MYNNGEEDLEVTCTHYVDIKHENTWGFDPKLTPKSFNQKLETYHAQ